MPRTGGISIHAQKIFWCPLANSRAQSFLKNLRIHVAHRRYCIHQKNDSFFNHLVLLNLLKNVIYENAAVGIKQLASATGCIDRNKKTERESPSNEGEKKEVQSTRGVKNPTGEVGF